MLVIGDSISMGYTLPLRSKLRGMMCVVHVPENAATSRHGIERLDAWLAERHWAVIHFNFGLHDIKRDAGVDEVPIDEYERNLRGIASKLTNTGARVVWASTTPVPRTAARHGRLNEDVVAYNTVAARVMRDANIPTDDLYTLADSTLRGSQEAADVHFNAAGYDALADQVVRAIEHQWPMHW